MVWAWGGRAGFVRSRLEIISRILSLCQQGENSGAGEPR